MLSPEDEAPGNRLGGAPETRNDEVLLVPPTVAAGACYLTGRYPGPTAQAAFPDSAGTGGNLCVPAGRIDRLRPRRIWLSSCHATPEGRSTFAYFCAVLDVNNDRGDRKLSLCRNYHGRPNA